MKEFNVRDELEFNLKLVLRWMIFFLYFKLFGLIRVFFWINIGFECWLIGRLFIVIGIFWFEELFFLRFIFCVCIKLFENNKRINCSKIVFVIIFMLVIKKMLFFYWLKL